MAVRIYLRLFKNTRNKNLYPHPREGTRIRHSMARHAVAVAYTVLIHALLGLVSAMPGPPGPAAPSGSAGPRLQCPHCFRGFKTHANFRNHQAAMSKSAGPTGCGRDVPHPMSSGWFVGGPRTAGTVADLSGQRARLPGIDDSDSDSSGRGGRRQVDQDGGGQDHPAAEDSEEEAGPAAPDSPAGHGGADQVHTYRYRSIHLDTYRYIGIPVYIVVYLHIPTDTDRYLQRANLDCFSFSNGSCNASFSAELFVFGYIQTGALCAKSVECWLNM